MHPLCPLGVLSDTEIPWGVWISSWILQSTWENHQGKVHITEKSTSMFGSETTLMLADANTAQDVTSACSILHQKNNFLSFIFPSPLSNCAGPWENPDSFHLAGSVDMCRIAFLLSLETSVGSQGHQDGINGKSCSSWYKVFSLSGVAAL